MNALRSVSVIVGLTSGFLFAHDGPHLPARPILPKSYEKPPEKNATPHDYVIRLQQMISFYDFPGEYGHMMLGRDHGFEQLSLIITETQPNGGPPLHTHETEEAHVLTEGSATYWIVDPSTRERRVFTVAAPYVARIPAGHPHTFINSGTSPFRLVAVFPDNKFTYQEVGPNPLVKSDAPPADTSSPKPGDAVSAVKALLREFLERVDEPAMHERFWADDLVYTSGKGEVRSKREILQRMREAASPTGATPRTKYDAEDVQVRDYGATAALTFRLVAHNPDGTTARYRNSGMFLFRDGKWQVVTWQATPET
jgi:mannose-6-phosphate isomerase-like protein (cupin superfamily)